MDRGNLVFVTTSAGGAPAAEAVLKASGARYERIVADSAADLEQSLATGNDWHCVICDTTVADDETLDLFGILHTALGEAPIIVVSDTETVESVERYMAEGARDFIPGDGHPRLVPAVRRELATARLLRERNAALEKLEYAEEFSSAMLNSISDGIVACDGDGVLSLFNSATKAFHGLPAEEIPADKWPDYYDLYMPDGATPMAMDQVPLFRALNDEIVHDVEMVIAPTARPARRLLASGRAIYNAKKEKIGAVCSMRDITDTVEARRKLAESEHKFQSAFESAGHGIALVGLDGSWLTVNDALCKIVGYSREELLEIDFQTITHPDDLDADLDNVRAVIDGRIASYEMEKRYIRKDGSEVPIILSVGVVRDQNGAPLYFVSQIVDISARRAAERALAQTQKMDAIGQLTGGIAHDFNNLLTIIIGNIELIGKFTDGDSRLSRAITLASEAAARGASLTARLLAFARRQVLEPSVIDLNDNIETMRGLLRQSLGAHIELRAESNPDLWPVKIDPVQFETAVLNLSLNGRDAMGDHGVLVIETRNTHIDEVFGKAQTDLAPGRYVCVYVSDNGGGIVPEDIDKVVEPFFTTKEVGKGTGLGLSMVYGFANQSGGNMTIYSEPGHGTSVKMYFPAVERGDVPGKVAEPIGEGTLEGAETILVVEDDPGVRETIIAQLDGYGYRVTAAEDGRVALDHLKQGLDVDLILTDVVMPGGVSGLDLTKIVRMQRPSVKVLVTSGYPKATFASETFACDGIDFIAKPYTETDLLRRIRALLDG